MARVIGIALNIIGIGLNFIAPGTGTAFIAIGNAILTIDGIEQSRRAKRRALALYNASLQDRLEMVERDPNMARSLVYGRVRQVEGVLRSFTAGENSEKLVMIVAHAGHQIDAFEQFYFFDTPLSLDSEGYVLTAPYNKLTLETDVKQFTASETGTAVVYLDHEPIADTVSAIQYRDSDTGAFSGSLTIVSVVGTEVTVSGGTPGARGQVNYQWGRSDRSARVRGFTGTAAQNIGELLAADYPGKITAAERFAGIALSVVEISYDPDIYPQGRPLITAVMRGARIYDPRKDSTAGGSGAHRIDSPATWEYSENPALVAYDYARHPNGWDVPAQDIRRADVVQAANVCDQSVDFPVTGAEPVTLPRYRCGIVISTAADPRESMNEIIESMAGRHGWAGGVWRMMAGHMPAPVFNMTQDWLARRMQPDGAMEPGPTIQFSNGQSREAKVNRVSGRCVDPAQRFQVLPFPAVEDPVLIEREGQVYPLEVEYQGVNHIVHAQHLGRVTIKRGQAPLRATAQCNLYAYPVELFDVGTLTLPRYGIEDKTMEVVGWRWSPNEGPQLQLLEITPAIYAADGDLTGRDPAPNTTLPSPWQVEELEGLAVTSGTEALTDGSILTRTRVVWLPATSPNVRVGGKVVIQFALIQDGPLQWQIWEEDGAQTETTIAGLLAGSFYVFRARFQSGPPLGVRGNWAQQVLHEVALPPAGGAGGISSYMIEIYAQRPEAPPTPGGGQYTFTGDVFVPPATVLPGDPHWPDVVLLLPGDDPGFADRSTAGLVPTLVDNISIVEADGAYDGKAMRAAGGRPELRYAASDVFRAEGPWTLEFRLRLRALPAEGMYFMHAGAGATTYFAINLSGDLSVAGWCNGALTMTVGQWYQVRVVATAANLRYLMIDGALVGTPEFGSGSPAAQQFNPFAVTGRTDLAALTGVDLQAIRFTRFPRSTGAYTPPTGPFPLSELGDEILWSRDQPEGSTVPTWVSRYLAQTTTPDVVIDIPLTDSWSTPNRHVVDGEGGAVLYLTASSQTFSFSATGVPVPTAQTITFTAVSATLTGTAVFTATLFDGSGASLGAATLGGSGLTRTLTVANFGAAQRCVVTVSLGGFSDTITVVRLRDGQGSIVGLLTNESVTVAADAAGVVESLAGTGGTFLVFDGLTPVTGTPLVTYAVDSEAGVDVSIASTGVYTVNSFTADTGSAVFSATYGGVTIPKTYSISKARAGAPGDPGNDAYVLEIENANVTVPADATGFVTSYTAATTGVRVIKGGTTDDTANWVITTEDDAGIVSSLLGTTVRVTSLTSDAGSVTIRANRAGFAELRGRFTVTRARSATTVSGALTGGFYSFFIDYLPPNGLGVEFAPDGTVKGGDSSALYPTVGNWYAPTTAGIGATHWIRLVPRSGADTLSSGTVNTWLPLSAGQAWTYDVPSGGSPKFGVFDYEISTSSSGAPVVGDGVIELFAGNGA